MKKIIYSLFLFLLSFTCIAQTEFNGILTAKCSIQQTGSGSGYWTVAISQFNDPRSNDATAIQVGDKLYFNDGGISFTLPISVIVSASGSNATVRVLNAGITGIGSVPTTSAILSRGSDNFGLPPWAANVTDNDNQMVQEYMCYLIDSLLGFIDSADVIPLNPYINFNGVVTGNVQEALEAIDLRLDTVANGPNIPNGEVVFGNTGGDGLTSSSGFFYNVSTNRLSLGAGISPGDKLHVAGAIRVQGQVGTNFVLNLTQSGNTVNDGIYLAGVGGTSARMFVDGANNVLNFARSTGTFMQLYANGSFVVNAYGVGNKSASTLSKTKSDYSALFATDGTVVENNISNGIYLPTATKDVVTDTVVTVYTHLYSRNDTVMNVTGRLLVNNVLATTQSSVQLTLPPGFTSDFTNSQNDITGTVTCRTISGTILSYPAWAEANTTTDKIVINWITDGVEATRQELNFNINLRKK